MKRVQKHDSCQAEFDLGLVSVRRAVLTLRRFMEVLGRPASGALKPVTYSDWLEFYTPLCSRGNGGGL